MILRPLAALILLGPASLPAQDPAPAPVIRAEGRSISRQEFERLLEGDPRYRQALERPELKRAIATEFGRAFALEAAARERGLDRSPEFELKLRALTQQLLAHELLTSLRKEILADEAALRARYDELPATFSSPRVRQIFVRKPGSRLAPPPGSPERSLDAARAWARTLRARLAEGADFAELAAAESEDLASRERGGDLGFLVRGASEPEIEAAVFSLPLGVLSDPIETATGIHIVRVEERRPVPFDEVKAALANDLAHRAMDAIVRDGFVLDDAYFAP